MLGLAYDAATDPLTYGGMIGGALGPGLIKTGKLLNWAPKAAEAAEEAAPMLKAASLEAEAPGSIARNTAIEKLKGSMDPMLGAKTPVNAPVDLDELAGMAQPATPSRPEGWLADQLGIPARRPMGRTPLPMTIGQMPLPTTTAPPEGVDELIQRLLPGMAKQAPQAGGVSDAELQALIQQIRGFTGNEGEDPLKFVKELSSLLESQAAQSQSSPWRIAAASMGEPPPGPVFSRSTPGAQQLMQKLGLGGMTPEGLQVNPGVTDIPLRGRGGYMMPRMEILNRMRQGTGLDILGGPLGG
jgi:hypothetical protein